jgi:hypothetical protein
VRQPGYLVVTGLEDGTTVRLRVGGAGQVIAGGDIAEAGPGRRLEFPIDRGEAVRIVGTPQTDLSGSVLAASAPVQVLSGAPCHYMPSAHGPCDHLEETVLPAETMGAEYVVAVPTNARGVPIGHVVVFTGNVDNTTLRYPGGAPDGAPITLEAGQVVDLGIVRRDFQVRGDQPFAVTSFQLGSSLSDPGHFTDGRGDPAQTNVYPVGQFRTRYVFLAPLDYDFSFADVVAPEGTRVRLDDAPVEAAAAPVGEGWSVLRLALGPGRAGGHVLEADAPVGLQVSGYGFATSYQVPGGLNLARIADPPIP